MLLAEGTVDARAEILLTILRRVLGPETETAGESCPFPPPFSEN